MNRPSRRALLLAAPVLVPVLALAATLPVAARAQGAGATAVVEALHAALLDTMRQARALGVRGREARLRPVLTAAFDLAAMARIAVGPAWSRFTPAQQAAMTQNFADWSIATYASRFDGFSGESFETLGEAAASNNEDRLVRTRINRTGGEGPVALTYLLRQTGQGWRIVDVFLTGTISEIASRRSEFAALLRDGGPDRLIAELQNRTASLLAR